ncbi:hypothetical protein [Novosphingobium guangzhouense]|uniref:Uncharacterized protein n=1 Tax=Novosphingobium guangzhouense TaxID=1850347 RepID=A0A2K2G6J2_9SPHN|nr:hypothetical protein [Novosphingobium guangzhouense]PNU06657.1 hypothetical protein A8V01_00210 [Novosphingobium guangzhouense]
MQASLATATPGVNPLTDHNRNILSPRREGRHPAPIEITAPFAAVVDLPGIVRRTALVRNGDDLSAVLPVRMDLSRNVTLD